MTRIWIELDDLDALKENLARIQWNRTHEFHILLLSKVGYHLSKGENEHQILEEIKDVCKESFKDWKNDMQMIPKPFEDASKGDRDVCYQWAESIINAIKQKGDVR